MDLKALTGPDEIIRAVKDAIKAPPPPRRLCHYEFTLPGSGGLTRLTVPMDARLEAKAQQWVRSDDKETRREGAAALVFFQSDANAAILKALLDDPASWNFVIQEGRRDRHERVYSVREEAASVLKAWGYDVPPRVIREPVPADPKAAPPAR